MRRTRKGSFELRLPEAERALLRSLPDQMRHALDEGDRSDPALARLYPVACRDDAGIDAEFHRLMDDELTAGRRSALDTLEATADADSLDEEQLLAWMRAINDVRLLLGTRLSVTEDPADRQVPEDDPRAQGFAVYDYLSWLEEQLVEALDR